MVPSKLLSPPCKLPDETFAYVVSLAADRLASLGYVVTNRSVNIIIQDVLKAYPSLKLRTLNPYHIPDFIAEVENWSPTPELHKKLRLTLIRSEDLFYAA